MEAEKKLTINLSKSTQKPDPLRILVAEDFVNNRLVIQAFLKKTIYQVDIVENGKLAVEKFISQRNLFLACMLGIC